MAVNAAVQAYGQRMRTGGQEFQGFERRAYAWRGAGGDGEADPCAAGDLQLELSRSVVCPKAEARFRPSVERCSHCRLPLGELVYGEVGEAVHGECLAQLMLQEAKAEREAGKQEETQAKKARRAQYRIGWKAAQVPRNLGPLGRLGFKEVPAGCAVCLVYDEASHSVSLAPTEEPVAAVNLEYLSIALKVRSQHGAEPVFSLDAVDPTDTNSMQRKVFEPEWLAGTSVGELMFQADYHLKELSMGEYDQPIVGMKSCFDFADMEGFGKEWSAREWFVMRKAEIHTSEDDVLIPFVKMGIEAREQVLKDGNLEDAPLTRANHPLVKYAEQFTHNFDLIAERKSVIYHLRELAKASVLAKFLVDGGVNLDSTWFDLAERVTDAGVMEIPQLWNERHTTQIQMEGGKIADSEVKGRNVMGGVDFGLDRFSVAAPRVGAMGAVAARLGPRAAARVGPMGRAPSLTFGGPARAVAQTLSGVAGVSGSLRAVAGPSAVFSGRSAMAPRIGGFAPRLSGFAASQLTAPQGVDLNLDNFNLSTSSKVSPQAVAGGWMGKGDDLAMISKAFWASLKDESSSHFSLEDRSLLREVFNPNLSDRAQEEEQFIPPATSADYVSKLRDLVKEEAQVRQRRKDHFHGKAFVMGDAGPLFPSAWTSDFEIARGRTPKKALAGAPAAGALYPRPEYLGEAHIFDHVMESSTPIFDMKTEDGMRYRVYRVGSLEVRTTQECEGKEAVGAVFSIRSRGKGLIASSRRAQDSELITKVTEYVQRNGAANQSYVVAETDKGSAIVTELTPDGTATWEENTEDVEDRNSLAKVVRTTETKEKGVSIREFKEFQAKCGMRPGSVASQADGKLYAQRAFSRATGMAHRVTTGFRQPVNSIVTRRWTPSDAARATRLEQERKLVEERTRAALAAKRAPEERKPDAEVRDAKESEVEEAKVIAEEAASTEEASSAAEEVASTEEASSAEEVASAASAEETSD